MYDPCGSLSTARHSVSLSDRQRQAEKVALLDGLAKCPLASMNQALGANCGGGTNIYNFQGTYSHPPVCTCMDNTALHLCRAAATSTTLTFSGTAADSLNYVCVVTN
jgi:hypothetical protein